MKWNAEWRKAAWIVGVSLVLCYLPVGGTRFDNAVLEALQLAKWYAREHVLLCLVPAFLIAGGISVFVGKASVMRHLGPAANKVVAYAVAAVSGTLLAVCSCTVLPLFAGIRRMGAGLGPACTFLYSGPAINVLAIILTARVLGLEMGIARAVGAIIFSVAIGLLMHLLFRKEEADTAAVQMALPEDPADRPLWKTAAFFSALAAILVFANWARSGDVRAVFLCCPGGLQTFAVEGRVLEETATAVRIAGLDGQEHVVGRDVLKAVEPVPVRTVQDGIYALRWFAVAAAALGVAFMLARWFSAVERREWLASSRDYALQILPLLFVGVLAAGLLLGRPGREGLVPGKWVEMAVGGSPVPLLDATGLRGTAAGGWVAAGWPLWSNLFASLTGAFMYFATLTEVPILQGLLGSGMGKGPALALLLAGPALSLPNMLVIGGVLGARKTVAFVALVVAMATASGMLFGVFF